MKNNIRKNIPVVNLFKAIILLILFIIPLSVSAQDKKQTHSNPLFTFEFVNTPIKQVFDYIQSKSDYVFLYYGGVVSSTQKVTVKVKKQNIETVLQQLFKNMPVSYSIKDRQIILKKAEGNGKQAVQQRKKKTINGIVSDETTSEPIAGAAIMLKGKGSGTTTDLNGNFTLQCSEDDTLQISFIGYQDKNIVIKSGNIYAVTLKEAAEVLDEVVVTAFGVGQKKESLVGAVEQIRPDDLKVPASNLSSAFAGRMAGVIAVQRSGEPGSDVADFWIRGKSTFSGATGALIVLDGVEITSTELNKLDPEVIESFSILKDATATALYGTRGANGVMVVTTKSGKDLDKPIINFRMEGALSQLSKVPEMVDGVTYMNLYNEAIKRPGSSGSPYSDEKIEGTMKRLNPYIYPDVDWYDEIFKKNSFAQRINFNIRGGHKRVDYFMSASFDHSDGNLKSISKDFYSFNNNINVSNYDFVNNLNIAASNTTKISLGLNVSIKDWKGPTRAVNEIFAMSNIANPVDFPIYFPSGVSMNTGDVADFDYVLWGDKAGGVYNGGYRNPVAEYVSGYKTSLASHVKANLKLEQKLDFLLEGLSFTGLFSFKNQTVSESFRNSGYNHFTLSDYNPTTLDYTIARLGEEQSTALTTTGGNSGDRQLYLQAFLDYTHTFGGVHDLNIMFLYNQQEYNTNTPSDLFSSLPQRKQGIAGRVSYGYANRYMGEVNFGYNGSENFAKGHRFGFFPSVAVGYRISEEKFWEPLKSVVSNLKLKASWGLVGNDQTGAGRFAYLADLVMGGSPGYTTGIDQNYTLTGPKWNRYYNPNLTWKVGEKINLGAEVQLFYDLNFNIDFFKETRRDIFLWRDTTIPGLSGFGGALIYANAGKMKNEGVDLSLDYNKQLTKDFFLSLKGTFTYAHNTILERDEPPFREYPNLSTIGTSLGQNLLFVSDGLFYDENDIKNSPQQQLGGTILPGDIKYKDQPNYQGEYDGVINNNDRIYTGNPDVPEIVYGLGASLVYKNWDFSLFFQGVAKTSLLMSGFHPFGTITINNVPDWIAEERWTEENNNIHATYPRLSKDDMPNNTVNSTYWLRNGAFLKLKNAEVGYTFKNIRFYVSGQNLLTFSPFKYWDPEMGGGNGLKYPTQRTFNIGFQISFNDK